MGVLRFRLRDATASAHRKVEAAMALEERCSGPDSYRALLARLWGLYAPLEASLRQIDWQGADVGFDARSKVGWLEADLRDMGMDDDARFSLPQTSSLPTLDDHIAALGALYVLEGASLGGQIISRKLTADLGVSADRGGRFFASYGPQVGPRWRDYLSVLERFADNPVAADRIEASALATFDCFLGWFAAETQSPAPAHEAWA